MIVLIASNSFVESGERMLIIFYLNSGGNYADSNYSGLFLA